MRTVDIEASLNPIRIRILVLLSQNTQMNASQIKEIINDVPQATLYRHINALLKANLINVVQENRVRGAIEKVYSVNNNITEEPTDNEILELGYKFILSMMGELSNYSKREDIDVRKDMLTFKVAPLYLSDNEFMEFFTEMAPIYQKYINNQPNEERTLRNIYTVAIPKK